MENEMKYIALTTAILLQQILMASCVAEVVPAKQDPISADHYKQVLFEDDFSAKKLGKRWGMYKSASTIREGAMVGITPEEADHPSVNTIRIDPQADLEVSVRFKFAGSKNFSVMYRDKECKSSHAGHICHVVVAPTFLHMNDGKTGIFRKDIRELRKAKKKLDASIVELLKTKKSKHTLKLDKEKWHQLVIRIQGDVMETYVDEKFVGRFQSEGIGHQRKDQVNLTTSKREMLYDDFQMKGIEKAN